MNTLDDKTLLSDHSHAWYFWLHGRSHVNSNASQLILSHLISYLCAPRRAQLKTGVLESALRREGHAHSQLAAAVADELAKAARVARGFARGLSPVLVQSGHLEDVLDELATAISESFAVRCEYRSQMEDGNLGLWVNTHVYRIVQELATNAAKHARPTSIFITVEIADDLLKLRVENDGIPFERRRSGGIGLELVAQRVRALGGRWSISPREDAMGGCIASCEIHLDARHFTDVGPTAV